MTQLQATFRLFAAVMLTSLCGCADVPGRIAGNWSEDPGSGKDHRVGAPYAVTITRDGWLRIAQFSESMERIDPATIVEARYSVTRQPMTGERYAVAGSLAILRDGDRLMIAGPGAPAIFYRGNVAVPSTQPGGSTHE